MRWPVAHSNQYVDAIGINGANELNVMKSDKRDWFARSLSASASFSITHSLPEIRKLGSVW